MASSSWDLATEHQTSRNSADSESENDGFESNVKSVDINSDNKSDDNVRPYNSDRCKLTVETSPFHVSMLG